MSQSSDVISHWHFTADNLSTSSVDFYGAVEAALTSKEAPSLRTERAVLAEGGVLAARREYLRVSHDRFRFDICAAPFGQDFFFSWWLSVRPPGFAAFWGLLALVGAPFLSLTLVVSLGFVRGTMLSLVIIGVAIAIVRYNASEGQSGVEDAILATPLVGRLYQRLFRPTTYYSEDSRLMFEHTVHTAVVSVVEGLLSVNKLPPLPAAKLTIPTSSKPA